jgi:hypothetical protein
MNTKWSQKKKARQLLQKLGTRAVLLQDEPYILKGEKKEMKTNKIRNYFRAFGNLQLLMVTLVMISAGALAPASGFIDRQWVKA